ncbi:MAG: efflux RND transporter periplasmic adaptor subunit [Pseudomonadota bacterium]
MSYLFKRWIVFVILAASVGLAVLMSLAKPPIDKKPVEVSAPLVEIIELAPATVRFLVASQGTVEPLTQTALSAEVAGTIVNMSDVFVAGGRFSSGDVLLKIDPTNYAVALETAQANVSQRTVEYDGAKKLRSDGYGSESALLSAKAQLAAAQAELTRAKRDLSRTVVRAPYDGLVRTRSAQLGDYVAPATPLGVIFATDVVEVRLPLPDADLAFVTLPEVNAPQNAQQPTVTLQGQFRGKPTQWRGEIVRTEGVVEATNRMVFSVARVGDPYALDAPEQRTPLPVGTFVKADIEGISIDNVVQIPRELVRGNNQVIFVDDEQQLVFRELDFLRTDARYAYVLADQLSENRVMTTTLQTPLNGMKVRVGLDQAQTEEGSDTSSVGAAVAQ